MQWTVERRLLSNHSENAQRWKLPGGTYTLRIARSATDILDSAQARLAGETFAD